MNWTEGNLARQTRGRRGKEEIFRQKQHFAKARANLAQRAKRGSPKASLLNRVFSSPRRRSSDAGSRGRAPPSNTVPSASHSHSNRHAASNSLEQSPFFGSSQPLHSLKRSRDRTEDSKSRDESFQEKKRRVLQHSDWIGASLYPAPRQHDPNSKVTSSKRHKSDHRWRSSKSNRAYHHSRDKSSHRRVKSPSPYNYRDVRIRIGSQEKRLGSHTASNAPRSARSDLSHIVEEPYDSSPVPAAASSSGRALLDPRRDLSNPPGASSDGAGQIEWDETSSFLVATASTRLYQPHPRPPDIPLLNRQRLFDSEQDGSTLAQVGGLRERLSKTQQKENDKWKQFFLPSEQDSRQSNWGTNPETSSPRISPGVSEQYQDARAHDGDQDPSTSSSSEQPSRADSEPQLPLLRVLEPVSADKDLVSPEQPVLSSVHGSSNDGPAPNVMLQTLFEDSSTEMGGSKFFSWPGLQSSRGIPSDSSVPQPGSGALQDNASVTSPEAVPRETRQVDSNIYINTSSSAAVSSPQDEVPAPIVRQLTPFNPGPQSSSPVPISNAHDGAAAVLCGNDIWKRFTLPDIDTVEFDEDALFKEAIHDAVADLYASGRKKRRVSPSSAGEDSNTTTSIVGNRTAIDESLPSSEQDNLSRVATAGSTSTEKASDEINMLEYLPRDTDSYPSITQAANSSITTSESELALPPRKTSDQGSHPAEKSDLRSAQRDSNPVPSSLIAEVSESSASNHAGESVHFELPTRFKSKPPPVAPARRTRTAAVPSAPSRIKRGGRSRKPAAKDGRVDIRDLPTWDEDEIEEFSSPKGPSTRKASIFGALDIE